MKLGPILDQIDNLSDDMCIFARQPWSLSSEAEIARLGNDFKTPQAIADKGLSYFLEVHVAKEVLEVFGNYSASAEEKRRLLLFYAENDAYPEWVYRR